MPFEIPQEVYEHFRESAEKGSILQKKWKEIFVKYRKEYPELAMELERRLQGTVPEEFSLDAEIDQFEIGDKIATRAASGKIINKLTKTLVRLWKFC